VIGSLVRPRACLTAFRRACPGHLSIAHVTEVVLVHPEVVAYLVQNRLANLADKLASRSADALDVELVYDDAVGHADIVFDTSARQRRAVIETQQAARVFQSDCLQVSWRGHRFDVHRDIAQIRYEYRRNVRKRFLDQIDKLVRRQFHQGRSLAVAILQVPHTQMG